MPSDTSDMPENCSERHFFPAARVKVRGKDVASLDRNEIGEQANICRCRSRRSEQALKFIEFRGGQIVIPETGGPFELVDNWI